VHGACVPHAIEWVQARLAAPEPEANREDMENIGRAFMDAVHKNLPGYSWSECPSEVIVDLVNQRDGARAAQPSSGELDPSSWSTEELWQLADRMGAELVKRGELVRRSAATPKGADHGG